MIMAFELSKVLHDKTPSERMPGVAAMPVVQKLMKNGAKAEKMIITPKPELGKDVVVFAQKLTMKDGAKAVLEGITIKGEKRFYLLQSVYSQENEPTFWANIAKKLKEL